MLEIQRLCLTLPVHDAARAERIAHCVAERLAMQDWPATLELKHLSVPPIPVMPAASDADIAARVAEVITEALLLAGRTRSPGGAP
jgi:hypothetical protein